MPLVHLAKQFKKLSLLLQRYFNLFYVLSPFQYQAKLMSLSHSWKWFKLISFIYHEMN